METDELDVSVDLFWQSGEGFEMHLQLVGTSVDKVIDEAHEAIERIKKSGGTPLNRGKVSTSDHLKCEVCGKKLEYREGGSRGGKPYKGYLCPDRDCVGKPVWVDDK